MSKGLRLTDLYTSIQGEGPRTGTPTTFVRFGGCNMRCPGWPCDTPYAIEPEQWRHDPVLSVDEILDKMIWVGHTSNVCITGGEPTMQPAETLADLAKTLLETGRYTIDLFTNASHCILPTWTREPKVSVILDWKLTGSGEATRGVPTRERNVTELLSKDWIKFVVASRGDFEEAIAIWKYLSVRTEANFTVGAAWDKVKERELVTWVLEETLPWNVNVQVHKYIFDPQGRQI